ncbi:aromatic prenyltransferase [Streptomyces triticirhizae]|uniref:Prenyltransferase n=1 Tax=Streptomyces triticirhizae TaxID=2483353 RepID=A0A3M2LNW6_9ACTN|nr:aromatic prenyltransferase [Streptomyces triticirhizae]RMI38233.1 prenyltransferase [Streptomyces triticirhizae]
MSHHAERTADTTALARIYADIEKSAGLLDVPCERARVWPILTAYEDKLARSVIAFRVATGARNAGDLDCRFTMFPASTDPYAIALANDLTAKTDHPVGSLLGEIHRNFPIDTSGIDFGVVGGFKKTWSFFPADDLQDLAPLAELPSAPPALGENMDFFTRHGLHDRVSLVGIDYRHRTVNTYFGNAPAECFQSEGMRTLLREIGLPEPSERLLRLGREAFGIYTTVGWDSRRIERICFAVMTPDPFTLPVAIEPKIEHFLHHYPHDGDDRRSVYAITSAPDGEYHKVQAYYQWRAQMLNVMLLSDSEEGGA